MAQLTVDIGGRPGIDCRGFCEYCYFKKVRGDKPLGCRYCLPFKIGCDYCTRGVKEGYDGFKDLKTIAEETLANLQQKNGDLDRITISGGGDPSCYPRFTELIELLGSMEAPLHIGYTSGKGWDDPKIADLLIDNGLSEISFTVFATDPALRRNGTCTTRPRKPRSKSSRNSVKTSMSMQQRSSSRGSMTAVVLEETCEWLEERGAKGIILMRFANADRTGPDPRKRPGASGTSRSRPWTRSGISYRISAGSSG